VLKFIHSIERTDLVSGETSVTVLHSSYSDAAWENDIETEKEYDRQRWKTSKGRRILGKTRE
jgi:hypothetical protein